MNEVFSNPHRRLFFPVVIALGAFCVLCGLGLWQVERKAWKENLISSMHERITAPPAALPPAREWERLTPENSEFRRVTARLQFPESERVFVYSGPSGVRPDIKSPGYFVFVPARTDSGQTVAVNVGFTPDRQAPSLAGAREITGYLRWPERSSLFVSDHDAAGETWFARIPGAMAEFRKWGPVAPFYIDQEAPVPPSGLPRPGPITVNFPNNHLGYALTWFGLALGLLAVFSYWIVRELAVNRAG